MGSVTFGILGPLLVQHGSSTIEIGAPKLRALLLRLLVDAGRTVATDQLIEDLWEGTPPPGAITSLRAYISNLRRLLPAEGGAGLVTRAGGYALDADTVDAEVFEERLAAARAARAESDDAAALALLDEALAAWRGAPLADVADATWAQPTRTRLEELRRLATEERFASLLGLGRHDAAIPDLERFVALEPLREGPHRQLVLALYRAGRTPEALAVHRRFRDTLIDELGLDPSPRFAELIDRVLQQDAALDPGGAPATQPGPGDPTAVDARSTVADGLPSSTPTRSWLVGRDRELRHLAVALERLGSGAGGLVLVGGEPGIGKTTLLEELGHRARERAEVHWGRCAETEGAPALWPWIQVLRSVAATTSDDVLTAAISGTGAMVLHLVPELAERTGVTPPPTGDDPHAARFALAEALSAVLFALAADRPRVLLLEDLHWADEPSLELLTALVPRLRGGPVLVAASTRMAPADRTPALGALLAAAAREPTVAEVELAGLSVSEVAAIVEETTGQTADEAAAADLHRRTNGNPFFVTQLAHLLDESHLEVGDTAIPSGVRHVIARRLAALPTDAQRVLEAAAVVGRSFTGRVVATALGTDIAAVGEALDRAHEHGLVEAASPQLGHFRFVHALIRETLYDGLSPAARARLHAAVGEALETHGAAQADELAEHHWLAGDLGAPGAALRTSKEAVARALEVLAYERAEVLLRRAVELAAAAGELDAEVALRVQLVSLLTSVAGWSHPDILAVADRVRTLTSEVGLRPDLLPLWHLSWTGQVTRGDARGGLDIARDLHARAVAAGDELFAGMALSMRGYCELQLGLETTVALDRILEARAALDRQPEAYLAATPEHLGVTVRLAEVASRSLLDDPGTMAAADELRAYAAERPERPFPLVAADLFAAWAAAVVGASEQALAWSSNGLATCERYGFRQAAHLLTPVHAWASAHQGADPQEQARRIVETLAVLQAGSHLHVRPQWFVLLADVWLLAGDPVAAAAAVADARAVIASTHEHGYDLQLDTMEARVAAFDATRT